MAGRSLLGTLVGWWLFVTVFGVSSVGLFAEGWVGRYLVLLAITMPFGVGVAVVEMRRR
jgi:hypothetical protein